MRNFIVEGCWICSIARGVIFSASLCLAGLASGGTALGETPQSAATELGWSFPSATPLQVHVVRGYSYRQYRMEEALAHAGANFVTESTQSDRGISQWGSSSSPDAGWLRRYDDAAGQAMNHRLIIVGAVGASAFGKNQQILVDFVRQGGSVLFLCDSSTFGSQSVKSAFAEMVPLEFPAEGSWRLETEQPDEPVVLKAGPDCATKELPNVAADSPPLVFSYYKVKPKPGAKVLLLADEAPVLILGEFGRGKVGVFAATCRGYARDGQLAYWEWDAWPGLLADTLRQLVVASEETPHGFDAKTRRAIVDVKNRAFDLLDGADEDGQRQFEELLRRAAMRCHDKRAADFLLQLIAEYPLPLPNDLADVLGQALGPWVDRSSVEHVDALIDSASSGKTVLGLIVLGATRSDGAQSTLETFYATGTPRTQAGSVSSLGIGDPMEIGALMQAEEDAVQIRRAAVTGLGQLGDPAALPVLKEAIAAYASKGSYDADAEPDAIEASHRNYQNAVMASLLCGDVDAAEPVIDFLLQNLSVISRTASDGGANPSAVWQQQLYRRLATVPDSVLPALAKKIADETSSRVVGMSLAAFGGKNLTSRIAAVLGESSVPAIAELGRRQPK